VRRPDARTALLFGVTAAASALTGPVPAGGVIFLSAGLAAWTGVSWKRLLPLAGSFAFLLLLVPFAPGPVARAVLQGLGVSLAVVVSVSSARWDRLVGALQALGAGRAAVAFLAITLSHLDAAGRDARVALDALHLRGGFRGARGLGRSTPLLLARTLGRAFERADRTAEALELRGFAGRVPPPPALRAGLVDVVAGAASFLAIALAVGTRLSWSR
jgi:energy-coupling factor transporter transmembrane protein EcfT